MFIGRICALALYISCAGLFSSVNAKATGESVDLKTIKVNLPTNYGELKTEIHYDEKDYAVALKVENIIKNDLIKAVNYFQYVPDNSVHFNVDPYTRLTNGNATVFPTNIINLFNFPPNNSDHLIVMEDWLKGLVFHEYIHITHLDQTRDWMKLGRQIFGSIAKLPASIVPRWFAEGIAVWGESHLLGSAGRLNNPLFRKELLIQFLKIESCDSIDCLDQPGVYPHGQLAYWAGGHFMEYLENQKAGTVKCLVEKNSGAIPFLLNDVFFDCTGKNAKDQFEDFRQYFIASQPPITPENEEWGVKINNAFGNDDYQKGLYLDGNILYKVEQDKKSEALVSYDLEENVSLITAKYSFPVSDISGMTTMPTEGEEESGKYLLISFNEDPAFRAQNRVWKLINADTLTEDLVLPFQKDPSYAIGLGNHRFLTASFVDSRWIIERQRYDYKNKVMFDPEVVHDFPVGVNLTLMRKIGQKIFLKFNTLGNLNTFVVSDLTLEYFYKVYQSQNYFDFVALDEKFAVIREKKDNIEGFTLFEFDEELKKISSSVALKDHFNRITASKFSDERVLVLENRLKSKAMSKKEALAFLKKGETKLLTTDLNTISFKEEGTPGKSEDTTIDSFPKWYHYKPHYWFLATGSSENISSIGAMTTFSDPMNLNTLNASVLTFPSISKVGGGLEFVHKFSKITDLWAANLMFDRDFSKSELSSVVTEEKEALAGTNYTFLMKRWTMLPGVYVAASKTNDFISSRSSQSVGLSNLLVYNSMSFDDTFQNLFAQIRIQLDNPDLGENFVNAKAKLQTEWRFYDSLLGGIKTSWAKFFKTNFNQGVVYGGGVNSISNQRWHEFYGIPYGNAYGNEIFTLRLYIDYNVWNIYRGRQFIPIFFKELHLLVGRETMYADRILLEKRLIREKAIHSFFVGPRLKVNLFYFVPADIDVIFSSINNPNGGTVNEVVFNIGAEVL
jgi:hypothetical protein